MTRGASAARPSRRSRRAARAIAIAPAAWLIGWDFARRAGQIATFDRPHALGYAGSVVISGAFWAVLLYAACCRRTVVRHVAAGIFVAAFTVVDGVQAAFHGLYNVYLSIDCVLHSHAFGSALLGELPLDRPRVALRLLAALAVAVGLLTSARRLLRPSRITRRIATALVLVALVVAVKVPVSWYQWASSPPDLIYFHGITALAQVRLGLRHDARLFVGRRTPEPVPALSRRPARPRNVVLILQESQRADVVCVAFDPLCDRATPASNAAAPDRMPLLQMRANASATANSVAVLWSGVRPTADSVTIHSLPLLWDYASAAGYDTAYWTSQDLIYGNARLYVQSSPIRHLAAARHLDPRADMYTGAHDRLLTEWVIRDFAELEEPFFAVVQYSNIHVPYVFDPRHAPFQPSEKSEDPKKNRELFNYYKNVVYLSDLAVGRLIEHVRASAAGPRTVLFYTSDHGEAFREHGQVGHSTSIYDEELRVPTWVDAPPGTLSDDERAALVLARDQLAWHVDVAPTLLDLLGLWDDPGVAPFRARMMGHPLTRPERTTEPVPITNCSAIWDCAFRDWGMMAGARKIEAREWGDGRFHCFDVLADPAEQNDLGEAACAPLPELARALYGKMPSDVGPGRTLPKWVRKLAGGE